MIDITITHELSLLAFWGIFIHWSMFLFQIPIFDNPSVPGIVKILFSAILSISFYPYLRNCVIDHINYFGKDGYWLFILVHALLGLTQGYLIKIILQVLVSAGSLMTQSIGYAAIRYFDPSSGSSVGPFEKLITFSVLVILLTTNAMTPMIKGVYLSFFKIQMSNLFNIEKFMTYFMVQFKELFSLSIILATPLVIVNIIQTLVMGILVRMVPQINILSIGFIINIGIGLLAFLCISNEMFGKSIDIYTKELGYWYKFLVT